MRLQLPDSVRMALSVPLRNPGRSALTALGLAIGVSAFIAMVSFGRGARGSVVSQFETLGSNLLRIKRQTAANELEPRPLTFVDVNALTRESTTLNAVVPLIDRMADVAHEGRHARTTVRGTTPGFTLVRDEPISRGGPFDDHDERERAKVCILGTTVAKALFPVGDPLGATVTIAGSLPCRVVGVFSQRGAAISGSDLDDRVVIPLSTFENSLGSNSYSVIEVRPKSPQQHWAAKQEINGILRRVRQVREAGDNYSLQSPDEVTRVAEQIGGILTGLLGGIAAVSLLVGGIGIMNIQLVSVAERTHEIGIRAALGASPEQILRQFLAEALVLAAIGVGAGVTIGVSLSEFVGKQMGWAHATQPDVVIFSAAFGIVVGTIFGYIPAKRAADLDPIEALRRE
ncbi:MAG: Macrolide export ATP-binding/permease protein MacB [Myxococcaceae bacterium]|nr:Macrolide export ATP-binding/permease protein MacB [Myxococcaceae bacterium]